MDHEDGYRKNIACFAHDEFRPEREWFRPEIEEVIKTSQDGWNSVNFSDPDKTCGMKVLTKMILPGKKISPFRLLIDSLLSSSKMSSNGTSKDNCIICNLQTTCATQTRESPM